MCLLLSVAVGAQASVMWESMSGDMWVSRTDLATKASNAQ